MTRTVLLLTLVLVGCTKLPIIPARHWVQNPFGAELYSDASGQKAAAFASATMGDSAQVCLFDIPVRCHYFQTDQQALAWLAKQYTPSTGEEKSGGYNK